MQQDVPSANHKPLSAYSGDERRQIAALARRNLQSDVTLILTGGFALLMILFFLFARWTIIPLAFAIGVRPTLVWTAMSFCCAVVWALSYKKRMAPRVAAARALNAAFLYDHEIQVLRENRHRLRQRAKQAH